MAQRVAAPDRRPQKKSAGSPAELQAWEAAGLHCSANERRADEASRDVEAWLKCKYMREHLGEEFNGVVTAVTTFGIFVTLEAMYVEGLVHITELGGDYYKFDEVRQELRGERTGIRYSLGAKVRVQVSRVDLDGRKIDFRLVREGDELVSRAMRDKSSAGQGGADPAGNAASGKRSTRSRRTDATSAARHESEGRGPSIEGIKSAVKKATAKKSRKSRR